MLPYLAVAANWWRAALTAVGEQILIALSAVLRVFFHYVLLPQQGVFAVVAVKTLAGGHCCCAFLSCRSHRAEEGRMDDKEKQNRFQMLVCSSPRDKPPPLKKSKCRVKLMKKSEKEKPVMCQKKSVPRLTWGEDEVEAGGCRRRVVQTRGWGRDEKGASTVLGGGWWVGVGECGVFYKYWPSY